MIQYQYHYDNLGQLTREDNRPMNKTFTWTYDAAGNLLTRNVYAFSTSSTGSSTETISYLYDEESGWNDLLTSYDGLEIAYDEIGNPTKIVDDFYSGSNGIWEEYGYEFVWSGRQLMGRRYYDNYCGDIWYDESMDMGFSYNADGIRTSKTAYGIEYKYLLNGSQIIGETWTEYETEHTLFYIYDESGSPLGIQYRTDAYGDGEFTYFFFEKNLQGDIVAIYNADGEKIGSYVYDAWGNFRTTTVSGNSALENQIVTQYNPFRYRGYYYDKDLGWYYLQSRYYNPQWGRFVNVDRYISTGTGLLGYNMFAYCNNNPVMNVDVTGELFITVTAILVGAGALIGAGIGGYIGNQYAKHNDVAEEDVWKYTVGGAIIGGIAGGTLGYVAAPAVISATGVAGVSITSAGIELVGTGGAVAAEQLYYYHVTSSNSAREIAQTQRLVPSAAEKSVCVLNFQPTLEQAKQLGSKSYETVIRFQTNSTTWIPDQSIPFSGGFQNLINGPIKIFDVMEVGFK